MEDVILEEQKRKTINELRSSFVESGDQINLVSELLGDGSWRVRKDAVDFAVDFACENVIKALICGLKSEDNAGLRNACQEALTRIGENALSALYASFQTNDKDVRKFILDIIGDIGSASSCDFLVKAFSDDDENVVIAACENIGKLRSADALPHLLKMLDTKQQWRSFVIIESLAQIGEKFDAELLLPLWEIETLRKPIIDIIPLLEKPADLNLLKKGVDDKNPYVMANCLKALYSMFAREPERFSEIKNALSKTNFNLEKCASLIDESDGEKAFALITFISEREDFFVEFLEKATDENLEFFGSLANYADFENKQMFVKLISRYSERKQAYIVYLCGIFKIQESLKDIIALSKSRYGHTRQSVCYALSKINGDDVLNTLFDLLADEYPDVRHQAVLALSSILTADNFPRDLVKCFFEKQKPQKIVSLLNLMARVGYFDETYINQALKSPSPVVRAMALDLISKNRLNSFINQALIYLADEDESVSLKAVEAVGNIGSIDNLKTLIGFLDSKNINIRKFALQGICNISPETINQIEHSIFKDHDPMFYLSVLDLFEKGAGISLQILMDEALKINDKEVFLELLKTFDRCGLAKEKSDFERIITEKKGSGYISNNDDFGSFGFN